MRRHRGHSDEFPFVIVVAVWILAEIGKASFGDLLKAWATKELARLGYGSAAMSLIAQLAEYVPAMALAGLVLIILYRYIRRDFQKNFGPIDEPEAPPAPSVRMAEDNPTISYTIKGDNNIFINAPPSQPLKFPRGVVAKDDLPTLVRFRPAGMVLLDSHNVSSVTDNGTGDYTISFARPLDWRSMACHALPPTASNFEAITSNGESIRIVFEGVEPEIVAFRFDD
ncbi:hypothetical protein [Bradyrhizobium sp. JYMT SZCCT0428]|uniref:hypothetical protein n=1 Tax=Bradyrhizobium sp. JYMT SZCCT0428 TaxID=2807673 RepID=UPI001BA6F2CA|nr:hypothetical protein [Bradyrhizobium sp. JYMT SZCCT0428]MBR1155691.1 hypothetical protein [Bradyrhizobium sp. JYMT SZCCT0428]